MSLTKKATLIMEIFNMKKTAKKRYAIKLSAYESKKIIKKGEDMINYPCGWFDVEQLPGGSRAK